jgi:hypothetical protein
MTNFEQLPRKQVTSLSRREALICLMLVNEVKNMRNIQDMMFIFKLNLCNIQTKKAMVYIACYNVFTIRIGISYFHVSNFSNLVFLSSHTLFHLKVF